MEIADIISKIKEDGGISWDRVPGILKIAANVAALFLTATGHYGAGMVALGVGMAIEPVVNSISDMPFHRIRN